MLVKQWENMTHCLHSCECVCVFVCAGFAVCVSVSVWAVKYALINQFYVRRKKIVLLFRQCVMCPEINKNKMKHLFHQQRPHTDAVCIHPPIDISDYRYRVQHMQLPPFSCFPRKTERKNIV